MLCFEKQMIPSPSSGLFTRAEPDETKLTCDVRGGEQKFIFREKLFNDNWLEKKTKDFDFHRFLLNSSY